MYPSRVFEFLLYIVYLLLGGVACERGRDSECGVDHHMIARQVIAISRAGIKGYTQ